MKKKAGEGVQKDAQHWTGEHHRITGSVPGSTVNDTVFHVLLDAPLLELVPGIVPKLLDDSHRDQVVHQPPFV